MPPLALMLALAAEPPSGSPPGPPPSKPVPEVTVFASRDAPRLVRTYPAAGATPDFGVVVLTVAFDQPMRADSAPRVASEGAPDCRPTWRLLADGKTFTVLCVLKAGEAAHLRLEGFRNVADRLASPVELAFTADADTVDPDLEDALKSAGLKPEDGPVMDWAPAPAGAAPAGPPRAVTAPTG